MYTSKYYTCEQIDQRLLQGYLDDYNEQNHTNLTKEEFLNILHGSLSEKFLSVKSTQNLTDDEKQKAKSNLGLTTDDEPTAGSENLVKSGGVYSFTPTVANSIAESDLDISDEQGNILVRYENGHIQTKNFSSVKNNANIGIDSIEAFDEDTDYSIGTIIKYDGLLYKFIVAHTAGEWNIEEVEQTNLLEATNLPVDVADDIRESDLDITDDNGNVLARFENGHFKTKNFDSSKSLKIKDEYVEKIGNDSGTTSSDLNFNYIGLWDSQAKDDGVINTITLNVNTAGICNIAVCRYDEVHGYIDIIQQYPFTVESGVNVLSTTINIKKGQQLFIVGNAVKLKRIDSAEYHVLAGDSNIADDEIESIWQKSYGCYFSWEIKYPAKYLTDKIDDVEQQVKSNEEKINDTDKELASLQNQIKLTDDNGNRYRLIVVNEQLVLEKIKNRYNKVLFVSHSWGYIADNGWGGRGMSSSNMNTDWISNLTDALNISDTVRVNAASWERDAPQSDTALHAIFDNILTVDDDIDVIIILLGANIPGSYRTYNSAYSKFSNLISFIKERSSAKIYLCSPDYESGTDLARAIKQASIDNDAEAYIDIYWNNSSRWETLGDAMLDATGQNEYFYIHSAGQVTHPSDIYHHYIANEILKAWGEAEINKLHSINVNSSINYHAYSSWVEGGRCSIITYNDSAPSITVTGTQTGNTIVGELVSLSNVSGVGNAKYCYHFDMPSEDINVVIS